MSESKESKVRITLESFVGELSWLFDVKKKSYHDKEVELLYHICKGINEFELKKAVRSAALANKTLPSMKELLKHITPRIHKLNESERKVEADNLKKNKKERCKMCDNGGTVNAYDTETKYTYAFRCECPFGQPLSKQIPLWNESRKPRFVAFEHTRQGAYEYGVAQGYFKKDDEGRHRFSWEGFMKSIETKDIKSGKD